MTSSRAVGLNRFDLGDSRWRYPGLVFAGSDPDLGEKFFSIQDFSGLQPSSLCKLIVVVNRWPVLWITVLTNAKSWVYLTYKSVHYAANFFVANLDKIFACAQKSSSAQSVPVDIK